MVWVILRDTFIFYISSRFVLIGLCFLFFLGGGGEGCNFSKAS